MRAALSAARTADSLKVQSGFVREWSDINDLTKRLLAVIAPSPESNSFVRDMPSEDGVRAAEFVSNTTIMARRMLLAHPRTRTPINYVHMGVDREDVDSMYDVTSTPQLTGDGRAYQNALSNTVNDMQRFFGIREELSPCAVLVSLMDEQAFVVRLSQSLSMYSFLKQVKSQVEPALARLAEREQKAERELATAIG